MANRTDHQQTTTIHLRSGVPPLGPGRIRGVNTESDGASLQPGELQAGINVRPQGAGLITRPGLRFKIDLGSAVPFAAGAVMAMAPLPIDKPAVNLWASALGCLDYLPTTGARISQLEATAVPRARNYATIPAAADRQVPIASYGTRLYYGDGEYLRELTRITPVPASTPDTTMPTPPSIAVNHFPGFTIRCLREFDGKLFIGLDAGAGASKIVAWDTLGFKDDITAINAPVAFGIWRDKLVAGFGAASAHIRSRAEGDAPGTWTTHALAGMVCGTGGNVMQESRQYLYIASGLAKLFRFDGTNVTLVRTIAGCATDGYGLTALTLHNGLLYYGWNDNSGNHLARIGRHDPDSSANEYVDTYKDITADRENFVKLQALASYRRQIYAGGQQMWMVATRANDIKAEVESVNDTGATAAGFDVVQFMRM